jgi:hypothetical protein
MATKSQTRAKELQVVEMLRHLHQIQSAVVVAVAALRHQNCELDVDISNVLQRSVADRIQDQIERLEMLSKPRSRTQ